MTRKEAYNYIIINANDNTTISALESANLVKKIGYNSGVYGWNWSAYIYKNNMDIIFIEGYRGFPKTNGRVKDAIIGQLQKLKNDYYNQKLKYYDYLNAIEKLFKNKTKLNDLIEGY